jgi:expansin (peptidoglycan-binding protein)
MLVMPRPDRGSVLALIPAGFLVLMILGALAVDSAATYLAQRQLRDSLTAASNDAVTAGLSRSSFYSGGAITLDPGRAAQVVCLSVSAQADQDLHDVRLWMAVQGAALRVQGTATVDAVFGRAIPGFGVRHVRASTTAVAATGPGAAGEASSPPSADALRPIACP